MDKQRNVRIIFYSSWIVTLILQAHFVELRGDEAYYWMYSKNLAWGYFDHPPVTAVLIKAGYFFFRNEVGVRIFFIFCNAAMIWVMEEMIQPQDIKLFYALILSIAFLQLGMVFGGGMFAIPDFPLLFLITLYFYFYARYLNNPSVKVVIFLSIVIALMLLSKYHGILIIGFTVLSNLSLLRRKSFWAIVGLSMILFLPHLWWQFIYDFPSLKYHLYERSAKEYSWSYTAEYLLTQPFILGPFIGILLIYLSVRFKPIDSFTGSLKFVILGTYIFFFFMTFKGRVEGNWTVITLVPLLYLGYNQIEKSAKLKVVSYYSFAISILLIITVRISLVVDILPSSIDLKKYLGARTWAKELKEKSKSRPVAFMNSYQRASLYEFYSDMPAFSLNNVWGRKNQFTIWDTESRFQGQAITLVANYPDNQHDSILFSTEYLSFSFIDNFRSTSNVVLNSSLSKSITIKSLDTLTLLVKMNFQNDHTRNLEDNPKYPSRIVYSYFQLGQAIEMHSTDFILKNEMIGNNQAYPIDIIAPLAPGRYDFYLSVSTGWLPPGINSEKIKITVK